MLKDVNLRHAHGSAGHAELHRVQDEAIRELMAAEERHDLGGIRMANFAAAASPTACLGQ